MKNPTPEDHLRWLERRITAGNWFQCCDDFLEILPHDAAWALQRIINLGKIDPKNKLQSKLRKQGWYRLSSEYMERRLKLKRDAQDRILNLLKGVTKNPDKSQKIMKGNRLLLKATTDPKRSFIEIRGFGNPRERYVRVNLIRIEQAIDDATRIQTAEMSEVCDSDCGDVGSLNDCGDVGSLSTSSKDKKKRDVPPSHPSPSFPHSRSNNRSSKHPPKPPSAVSPECYEIVDRIKEMILRRNWLPSTKTKKTQVEAIKKLLKQHKDGGLRLRKLLDCLEENIKKIDRPTLSDAVEFCTCFNWLEDLVKKLKLRPKQKGATLLEEKDGVKTFLCDYNVEDLN